MCDALTLLWHTCSIPATYCNTPATQMWQPAARCVQALWRGTRERLLTRCTTPTTHCNTPQHTSRCNGSSGQQHVCRHCGVAQENDLSDCRSKHARLLPLTMMTRQMSMSMNTWRHYRFLLRIFRALLRIYPALLRAYRAVLRTFRALLRACRWIVWKYWRVVATP